jgi:integrase
MLPRGISKEAIDLYNASIRSSSKDRYYKELQKFFEKFDRLNRLNVINHLSTLTSVSTMEVFLSAVARYSGVSLFRDSVVKRIILGKAQARPAVVFPRIVNTIDLYRVIRTSSQFSPEQKFILQVMILTCARPSDLEGLSSKEVKTANRFISVARLGTKSDLRRAGTAVLIPISKSVFIPSARVMKSIKFDNLRDLMSSALKLAFPGCRLAPGIIRKSSACMLKNRGLPFADIMEIGGWRSEQVVRRAYVRSNVDCVSSLGLKPEKVYSASEWPEMLLSI